MKNKYFFIFAVLLTFSLSLSADERSLLSPLETRVIDLSKKIRCLECPFQDIEGSTGEFASDLKQFLRQHLEAGKTEDEILEDLTQKYGAQILVKPPLNHTTLLLWLTPFGLLLLCFLAFFWKRG